jgi:hypothetical protein
VVVIPYKKCKEEEWNFDDSYNLLGGWLFFVKRSGSIIATFVRLGKTHFAESGDP